MQFSQQAVNNSYNLVNSDLLEKVILENDLSKLTSLQKVEYVKGICKSIGLNPVTKPIQLMKFQGREIPYFTKDASEQLRKINGVSITKIDTKLHEGGLYVVTVYATDRKGRHDCSTGTIVIHGLKGDALANAMMKAETKAKRRVTLSICGLGFIDELEADSLQNVQKIDILAEDKNFSIVEEDDYRFELSKQLAEIEKCESLEDLKYAFDCAKRNTIFKDSEILQKLIQAKDIKKQELQSESFINEETGEIQ